MENLRRKILCCYRVTFTIVIFLRLSIFCEAYSVNTGDFDFDVKRFEPVFYNNTDVLQQHQRLKRSIFSDDRIRVEFFSHGRNFELNLAVDNNIFHPDAIIENSDGPISYDTRKILSGHINGEPSSAAYGIIHPDGVFDGYLATEEGDEYYMQPKKTQTAAAAGIMYRPEDVEWSGKTDTGCASHELHLKVREESHGNKTENAGRNPPTRSSRRKRWAIDPKKKTCMLYLQADHLFYERFGSEEACIDIMTKHIQRVNDIYSSTDFDNDGKPDDITFMIKRVKVHTVNHTKDPGYRYDGEFQVIKFLELFSEGDYDSFCLAYMFTFRDFEGGTLGLAWTGDLKNAGGVCEKKGHFRGGLKSLNTGIITLLNYGKVVPPSVSYVTLAHEIGHNFGSPHDPEVDKSCVPGGEDGNFIMFARATAGDRKNNNRFSPCSLRSILPVLNIKARDLHGCFTEPQRSICGNGVVEDGEECDCGWEEDCKETCCFPMQLRPSKNEPPCKLRPQKACSPSQGPCCTDNCNMKIGGKCRDDNGCRDAAYCDGLQPFCPSSISKPNKTICNKESVCFMGECTGSICLAYGLESCQCNPTQWESSSKLCELCCKAPGEGHPCISSFQWNEVPFDVPDMFAKPGSPCKNYTGYCDAYQTCREIDPSGPLATLRKLLLADEGLAFIAEWIDSHWYAVIAFVVFIILLMIGTAQLCGKRAKARLRKLTVMHSNVEAIQIQRTYLEDLNDHTVHPTAVRKKIPFKKKVRERRSKTRNTRPKERQSDPANLSKSTSKGNGSLWRKKKPGAKPRSKKEESSKEEPKTVQQSSQSSRIPSSAAVQPSSSSSKNNPAPPPVATTSDIPAVEVKNVPTTSSLSSQLPQITHEVNTAIVPHAKEHKSRKVRKSHGPGGSHPISKEKSSSSKSAAKSSAGHATRSPTAKANAKKKPSSSDGKKTKPSGSGDGKTNIQVVYRAPFSVKVQVLPTDLTKSDKKEPGKDSAPKRTLNASTVLPETSEKKPKPSTASFLQRRQRAHMKKSKNPSQSELRVLIPPNNEEDDLQSPITPGT